MIGRIAQAIIPAILCLTACQSPPPPSPTSAKAKSHPAPAPTAEPPSAPTPDAPKAAAPKAAQPATVLGPGEALSPCVQKCVDESQMEARAIEAIEADCKRHCAKKGAE